MNKINNYNLLGVVAVLMVSLLASCNNDAPDYEDKVPVKFSAIINNDTWNSESRSNIENWSVDEFVSGDEIVVNGWMLGSGESFGTPNFMNAQSMSYSGSSWDYSPEKYMTNIVDQTYSFYAYNVNETVTEKCVLGGNNSATGYSSMIFSNCKDWVKDVLVAPMVQYDESVLKTNNGLIPFQFYHIMARLKVKVRFMPINDDESMLLNKLEYWWHSSGGTFTGFNSNNEPQWSDIVMAANGVYENGNGNGYVINKGEEYVELPDFTRCQIPFKSPCKETETKDRYTEMDIFVTYAGDAEQIKYEIDDLEFDLKAGYTTTFYVTFTGKGVEMKIENDNSSSNWWGESSSIVETF